MFPRVRDRADDVYERAITAEIRGWRNDIQYLLAMRRRFILLLLPKRVDDFLHCPSTNTNGSTWGIGSLTPRGILVQSPAGKFDKTPAEAEGSVE